MEKVSLNLAETTNKNARRPLESADYRKPDGRHQTFRRTEEGTRRITQKVLTSNLRMLEENGILVRHVYAQIPPRVDYTLTSLGYNLKPVIDSMVAWAMEYRGSIVQEFNDIKEKGKAKIEDKIKDIKSNF